MRNRSLHDALRDFALEAAAALSADVRAGAELEFDVVEEPGPSGVLYNYRPLTAEFIAQRWPAIAALPARERAARELGSGAQAYLRVRGVAGVDADPALQAMLERLYEGATEFTFPEERFERVYAEVERTLYDGTIRTTVLAPLEGLWMESTRVPLGDGLCLVRGEAIDAPPEAVWGLRDGEGRAGQPAPNALCVLERDLPTGADLPTAEARMRFAALLSGMRLYRAGGLALPARAWARVDEGPWRAVSMAPSGPGRGRPWTLTVADEEPLREFLAATEGLALAGTVAWARRRFEMGCERAHDVEALSDYLLALEALLDGDDDAGRASLALRLAALCAEEGERRAVARRVGRAYELERFVIVGGNGGQAYMETVGAESPQALVHEIEEMLRALLRDLACGYLDADLRATADEILLESIDELEARARERRTRATDPAAELRPGSVEPLDLAPACSDAVTPSADWGHDEDASPYGAPV